MGKKQDERRWFLIKHKKCKAIFTIDSCTFPGSFKNIQKRKHRILLCPNCWETVIDPESLTDVINFLNGYETVHTKLKQCSIREVKPKDLNYESLPQYLLTV